MSATKKTLGKVIGQVKGLRIRIILTKGIQSGIGIYHGKHLLESYKNNELEKAKKEANDVCEKKYFKRDLVNKLVAK